MKQKSFNKVVGWVFAVIAILHFLRAVKGWEAQIGEVELPMWASYAAILVAAYLASRAFSLSKN